MFKGNHIFDLRTTEEWNNKKPILLFGGMNGCGKTTLFEGVKLCLYGRYLKGYKLDESAYRLYLREKIHRHSGLLESDNSSVSLEFEHVHLGRKSHYFVKRTWSSSTKLSEELTVLQDGKPLEGIPPEQLQDFLIELIPLGLSNLFFFDGEQIQNLAEDQPDNRHLADAFNTLLGLDILQHLETDIGIHLSKRLRYGQSKAIAELTKLAHEHALLSSELEEKRRERAQKQTEIDSVVSQIDSEERGILSQGGGYSSKRNELKARKEALSKEIGSCEEHIRELASSLLPFSIVPSLCKSLRERLMHEEESERELIGNELLYKAISDICQLTKQEDFWKGTALNSEQRRDISERFINSIRARITKSDPSSVLLLHHFSPADQRKILSWIDQALNWVPFELKDTTTVLESRLRELRSIEEALSSIPPDESLAPFIRNLNSLHEKLGSLRKEAAILDDSIRVLAFKIKENERLQVKGEEEQRQAEKDKDSTQLASKVRDLLREFSTMIRKKKLQQVSIEFVEAFNSLAAKKNLIDKIQIGEEDFSLKIYRKDGVVLPKNQLSAGEKQIYAIAMLTALARVSGRPLPFIIDTPLARLDSQHRRNLVQNFFPKVSHQVIMFSTNTEIDKEYFELLEPSTSRAYLLTYDENTESTSEYPGYFWKPTKVFGQI